jgi:predicted DCC family thiol-disulfide oxidoreductase YuxK
LFPQSCGVNPTNRVAAPPPKPLLVYDGDCRFCTLWIKRWQQITSDQVDYLPFQDASVAARFPDIPREQFATAVQLIEPSGEVFSGARAAFGALASNASWRWPLRCYESSRLFAHITEGSYRFVAKHRAFFSRLTRFCGREKAE